MKLRTGRIIISSVSILVMAFATFFAGGLGSGACSAANLPSEVRVGSELEFPPYASVDESGQPAGFSVDLIKAVADAMGLSINISTGPWDTVWNALVVGRLDVLPLVARLPERLPLVDFSLPHTETYDAFFVRKGNPPIKNFEGARGKEIAVMRSDAAHHALLERNFQGHLTLVDTIPEGLSLISSGKHDAFLCSKLIGTMSIKKHGLKGLTAGPPVPDYKRVFSFAVKKGNAELLEKLNQGLLIIKANGEYDRIYEKWLTVDDPWRKLQKYMVPAIAIVAAIALIVGVWLVMLQLLVKKRTRELAERNEMLHLAQEGLEEKVNQRTAELSRANVSLQTEITERKQAEEAVKRSEEKYRDLIRFAPTGIYEVDFRIPRFSSVNDVMCQYLGYSREELLQMNPSAIMDEKDASLFRERIRRQLNGEKIDDSVEYKVRAKDGREYYAILNITFTYEDGKPRGAVVIAHDITERKRAEEALQKNKERFEILSETASRLLVTDEPQKIINELCQNVMTFLDCHAFFNYLVDEEKGCLHLNAYAGIPEEAGKGVEWLDFGSAVCGCAARDGCRIVAEDIPNTPDPRTELVKSFGIKAYACHPLFSAGRVMGTLSFGTRSRPTFNEEELLLMKTVAGQVAIAMERIRLIEALRKSRDELEMRVQERTEELRAKIEELGIENEERLRVEIELRESENRLRELSTALLSAQERERKLIAGEIHDGLGASLAATKFKVEAALNQMEDCNPKTRVGLESVIPVIQGTIEEARRIQMSLRPSMLDDLGILPAINWFCRQFEATYSNIHITKELDIQEDEVPEALKIVIFRVLQEALNNVAKHSRSSVVLINLHKAKQEIQLVVRDKGQGFDPEEASSRKGTAKGLGLESMRERAELSGGSFSIESSKGVGTVIRATWPLNS